ncbi:Phosphatidic acid phosphatase type 2/haloperoxidase [Syntrophomonas zehnderi OL-4]|uniref:Phosphatidic acid phosphatase type 2/haloperoxidase n=1 Tax=Syntrophomonas zehnderi OL-4 TaxID=690567 RepID=A0A0E4GEX8_9FIRM|nr:phosphatase PAP2 family protein [Syntrophomonas zehnderi]CFX98384.1 Phosphatidic acid phosphatase type 2/haloperoxidase [Syntrophomonas zehnderi OL-4]
MSSILSNYFLQRLISKIVALDYLIQQKIMAANTPWLSQVMAVITNLGSPLAYITIAVLVFIGLGWQKRWWEALFSISSLFSAWVLMGFLKNIIARPRPLGEALTIATGFSFPSGHAMLSLAFYGFLALVVSGDCPPKYRSLIRVGFSVLILIIGFSRVYLNVHYTSDVLAGYILGALILAVNWWVMKKTMKASGESV